MVNIGLGCKYIKTINRNIQNLKGAEIEGSSGERKDRLQQKEHTS